MRTRAVVIAAIVAVACGTAGADDRLDYARSVYERLQTTWHPDELFRAHVHGRQLGPWIVDVQVTVGADGELRALAVVAPSTLPAFDDEAVRAIRAASPLPAPPSSMIDTATGTATFIRHFIKIGWGPPAYVGAPMLHAPQTREWSVGTAMAVERDASGGDASYQRLTLSATAVRAWRRSLIEVEVPYEMIRYREAASASAVDASGLGDMAVRFYGSAWRGRWSGGWVLGFSLPTGRAAATPVVGTSAPAVVQLGTATFVPELGSCLGRWFGDKTQLSLCDRGRMTLYADSHGYRDPWTLDLRAVASRSLLCRHLSVQAGLFIEEHWFGNWNGHATPLDGHTTIFAEASAWFVVFRGLTARAAAEWPVYQQLLNPGLQDSARVITELSYDFSRW